MLVKARGQTYYGIYSGCLSGRCSTRKSERSDTRYVVYSVGGAMKVEAGDQVMSTTTSVVAHFDGGM